MNGEGLRVSLIIYDPSESMASPSRIEDVMTLNINFTKMVLALVEWHRWLECGGTV